MAGAIAASADETGKVSAKADARSPGKGVTAKASLKPASAKSVVPAAPGPGRMQVEEPKSDAAAPDAGPAMQRAASKAWQKTHAKGGLTEAQKQAFKERKEKMEGMIAVIKAKRKAMHDAKPEERAALARELHSLILEKESDPAGVTAAARVEPAASESKASPSVSASDARKSDAEQRREEYWKQQREKLKQLKPNLDDD